MFKLFGIILLVLSFGKTNETFSPNCSDISNEEKLKILSDFQKFYTKYELENIRTKTRTPGNSEIEKVVPYQHRENLVWKEDYCEEDRNMNNNYIIHKWSTCPWIIKVVTREDRYPSVVKEVECFCRWCNSKYAKYDEYKKEQYECMPVNVPFVGLKRGECIERYNVYNWTPTIESRSVACICSKTQQTKNINFLAHLNFSNI